MTGALLLAAGAVLLLGGAELFMDNATGAASRLRISMLAVGLLLAGAEPEELVTSVLAAADARPGLAAGDAIGANITMLTAGLGLAALARPVPIGKRLRLFAASSATAGALALAALWDGRVGRPEGAGLLAAYVALVAVVCLSERQSPPAEGRSAPTAALPLAVLGLATMLAGGALAVAGAVRLVETLELTETAVGLTLLALATTAELVALIAAAARRGLTEVAVAGVVGAAAWNATATLGTAAMTRPLVVEGLRWPALAAAALPLALTVRLSRQVGAALVIAYAGFVVLVVTR